MKIVLVLTNTRDTSTDWVISELKSRNLKFIRLNSDILDQCSVNISPTNFFYRDKIGKTADLLQETGVVYLRRPDPPIMVSPKDNPEQRAVNQFRGLVG